MMAQPLGGRLDLQCEAMAAGSDGAWDRGRERRRATRSGSLARQSRLACVVLGAGRMRRTIHKGLGHSI